MKKIIPIILVLSLCLCLSGCNGQAEQSEDENSVAASAEELSSSQSEVLFEEEEAEEIPAILTGGELYAPDFDDGYEVYVEERFTRWEDATHTLWRAEDDSYKEELYQLCTQLQCYRERGCDSDGNRTGDSQSLVGTFDEMLPSIYFVTEKYGYAVIPLNWSDKTLRTLDGLLLEELGEQPCFVVHRVDLDEKPSSLSALDYTRFFPYNDMYERDSLNGENGYGWISLLSPENYEEWLDLLDSAGSGNCTAEEELESNYFGNAGTDLYNARVDDLNIPGGELYAPDFESGYRVFVEEGYDLSGTGGDPTHFIWEVTDSDTAEELLSACYELQCYLEAEDPYILLFGSDISDDDDDILHNDPTIYLLTENYGYTIEPLHWENSFTAARFMDTPGLDEMQICRIHRYELTSNGLTDSVSALEELRSLTPRRDSVNHYAGYGWLSTAPEEIFNQIIAFPEQINDTNSEVILTLPE